MEKRFVRKYHWFFFLVIICLVFTAATVLSQLRQIGFSQRPMDYRFVVEPVSIVDGDTFVVSFTGNRPRGMEKKEIVRLIGVDCPEPEMGKETDAMALVVTDYVSKRLTEAERIEVQFDAAAGFRDRYNRILCYVWIDDVDFNKELIEIGYAYNYPKYAHDESIMAKYVEYEKVAKEKKVGVWAKE